MPPIFSTELPLRNLTGVEDGGLITESVSIPRGQGVLKAGCLLQPNGVRSVGADLPHSVLAFDTDTGAAGTTGAIPVTIYKAGAFLRHTVEAASGFVLTAAQIADLRAKGIFLERSVG